MTYAMLASDYLLELSHVIKLDVALNYGQNTMKLQLVHYIIQHKFIKCMWPNIYISSEFIKYALDTKHPIARLATQERRPKYSSLKTTYHSFATMVWQLKIWHFFELLVQKEMFADALSTGIVSWHSLQNSPLESRCVVVALVENYSTSEPLNLSLEKPHILSCNPLVANDR